MTSTLPPARAPATRRLPLAGTYNLRDVGGYAAGDRTTRWGRLFRSDALHAVDQPGRDALAELGLGLVVDLRENDERTTAPNALTGLGHHEVHNPVYDGPVEHTISGRPGAAFDLASLYRNMIADNGETLTGAVRLIAAADTPALVHCTAGKDRTGLVVALTLSAVGVGARDVVADYALSETMLHGEWAEAMVASFRARVDLPDGFDIEGIVSASPAGLMRTVLADLDAEHGGAANYLRSHGMSDAELTTLRTSLLS
jgi:protein-tyrosine phosphatase